MRKKLCFFVAGAVAVMFFLGNSVAFADTNSELFEEKIVEYKELFKHTAVFTEEDLRKPYQLSEDELAAFSTEELAQIVLAYPYLIDIYAFDSLNDGLQVVRSRYNGLDELLSRDDASECLTQLYSEKTAKISRKSATFDFDVEYLEVMLAQDEFEDNRDEITETFSEARDKKELSKAYEGSLDTYLSVLNEQGIASFVSDITTTVKNPKGIKVMEAIKIILRWR